MKAAVTRPADGTVLTIHGANRPNWPYKRTDRRGQPAADGLGSRRPASASPQSHPHQPVTPHRSSSGAVASLRRKRRVKGILTLRCRLRTAAESLMGRAGCISVKERRRRGVEVWVSAVGRVINGCSMEEELAWT